MNTFGEISEPISRNVWEDWDDNIPENNTRLAWQNDLEVPNSNNNLLIIEGRHLCDTIDISKCNLRLINTVPKVNVHLYKSTENNYVCFIRDYDVVLSSEIIELLYSYITASGDVLTILTKPLAEYQGLEGSTQGYIVRKLSTKNDNNDVCMDFPRLEQPNIISGVSAGAVSLRDHLSQPANAVVFYIENPEVHKVDELQKVLTRLGFVMHKSKNSDIFSSNLYI